MSGKSQEVMLVAAQGNGGSDTPEFVVMLRYAAQLYISFDIDTLDPSFVPGTGTPEPGGLTSREAFPIVRRLCAESNVVGFELVELAPMLDPTYVSAPLLSHKEIHGCC